MDKILKALDPKTITSVGGIILAIILSYFLYDLTVNQMQGLQKTIAESSSADAKSKEALADALLKNAVAIEGNTKIMEQLLRDKQSGDLAATQKR